MKLKNIFGCLFLLIIGFLLVGVFATYDIKDLIKTKAFIVLSGSMEPTVPLGGLAVVIPQKTYFPRDIVSFTPGTSKKDIVTHRLVAASYDNKLGSYSYYTAGDANKNFDQQKINDSQILGRVIFTVPYVGYVANSIKTPYGFILVVIIPATIIVYEELKNIKKELANFFSNLRKNQKKVEPITSHGYLHTEIIEPEKSIGIGKIKFVIPVIAAFIILIPLSISYFSDKEESLVNAFQAGIWATPSPTPSPTPGPTEIPTPTVTESPSPSPTASPAQ